ncbi:MAG: protein tyrosine phosphatase family protein [Opitutaceae bacterium]
MPEPAYTLIHNFRAVDESLITSGQPTVPQLQSVAEAGFETVINLALHDQPRYSLPDEPGTVVGLGMRYVHIPVQFETPTEANLLAFFESMEAHRGEKVLVHCAANLRVTVFLGLYWAIRLSWPDDKAFQLLRGLWQPNEVWSAFIAAMLAKHRGQNRGDK